MTVEGHRRQPKVVVVVVVAAVGRSRLMKTKIPTKAVVCRLLFDNLLQYEGHFIVANCCYYWIGVGLLQLVLQVFFVQLKSC